jgi:hypothetical protein
MWHISGSLGSDTVANRTEIWRRHNKDMGDGSGEIKQVDMTYAWNFIKTQVQQQFSAQEYEAVCAQFDNALGIKK